MNITHLVSDLAHLANAVEFAILSLKQHPRFEQAIFHFANEGQTTQYQTWVTTNLPKAIIKDGGDFIISVTQ